MVFIKSYLDRTREPKKGDLGDQLHSRYFPFCEEIVIENDQADVIRTLQRLCPEVFWPHTPTVYTRKDFLRRIGSEVDPGSRPSGRARRR